MSDSSCLVKSEMMLMERKGKQRVTSCDSGGHSGATDTGTVAQREKSIVGVKR